MAEFIWDAKVGTVLLRAHHEEELTSEQALALAMKDVARALYEIRDALDEMRHPPGTLN